MPIRNAVSAYIGLGSNLAQPAAQVRQAQELLGTLPDTRVARCSSLYRTRPIGDVSQPDFINAACALETVLAPDALLGALLALEARQGRVRTPDNVGGPRVLDLDLLLYGDACLECPDLTVPHPRLHERAFVLYPLAEIAPDLIIPGRGAVSALRTACGDQGVALWEGEHEVR